MIAHLDCVACIVAQAVRMARLATDDPELRERVLVGTFRELGEGDIRRTPLELGAIPQRLLETLVGVRDPYLKMRDEANRFALELYPRLRELVEASDEPLLAAAKIAMGYSRQHAYDALRVEEPTADNEDLANAVRFTPSLMAREHFKNERNILVVLVVALGLLYSAWPNFTDFLGGFSTKQPGGHAWLDADQEIFVTRMLGPLFELLQVVGPLFGLVVLAAAGANLLPFRILFLHTGLHQ